MVQDGEVYHYHLDHLGTPQELSNSEGKIVWKARYQTYGNVAYKEVDEIENNIRFQGQYFDEESGLHYNRHRYYDPGVGQFTTQDPIGLLGGVNNYQYAPNPTGWVDPFGLSCKEEDSIPKGVAFEGTVYRYENPDRVDTTWDAHKWNKAANHRYTEPGINGVYAGTSAKTAEMEISHYGALDGRVLVNKDASLKNVLDLTNPKVRDKLGVSLDGISNNSYDKTHAIGRFAKENGYDGILAPSARNSGGSNLVSFSGY